MERPFQEIVGIREWRPSCAAPGSGTLRRSSWLRSLSTLTFKAGSYAASRVFAGEAPPDLRRCWRARCGRKTICGAACTTLPSGWSELPGADPPARRSGRKAQPRWSAVATVTSSARLPSNRMGLPAKRLPPPPLRYGIEAEWRKRGEGVVPAQPKARPGGQRPILCRSTASVMNSGVRLFPADQPPWGRKPPCEAFPNRQADCRHPASP